MDRGYWRGKLCGAPGATAAADGVTLCPVHRGLAVGSPDRLAKQPHIGGAA